LEEVQVWRFEVVEAAARGRSSIRRRAVSYGVRRSAPISGGGLSAGDNLTCYVPWVNLGAIFAVLYPVALATTYLPARRAARVCPAEPLRFR
jgi:ABC-type lipoprotein release transport system permease subunit